MTLEEIASEVKTLHSLVESACEKAVRIGELLLQAKAKLPHGGFLPWLAKTGLKARTAQDYVALAKGSKTRSVAGLGIGGALRALREGRRIERAAKKKPAPPKTTPRTTAPMPVREEPKLGTTSSPVTIRFTAEEARHWRLIFEDVFYAGREACATMTMEQAKTLRKLFDDAIGTTLISDATGKLP